jgi:hypothetical protein
MSSVVYSRARSTVLSFAFARSASRSTPSASAHLCYGVALRVVYVLCRVCH